MRSTVPRMLRFAVACALAIGATLVAEPNTAGGEEARRGASSTASAAVDHCRDACASAASSKYSVVLDFPSWFAYYAGCYDSCTAFHS